MNLLEELEADIERKAQAATKYLLESFVERGQRSIEAAFLPSPEQWSELLPMLQRIAKKAQPMALEHQRSLYRRQALGRLTGDDE